MTREIALVNGGVTLVDDDLFAELSQYPWRSMCGDRYVARNEWSKERKRIAIIYMHRQIMNAPADKTVDHLDYDGFNNQRANLRLATQGENNRRRRGFGSSLYKGVSQGPLRGSWLVIYGSHPNSIHIGTFYNEVTAARSYDAYAAIHGDEFTVFNFPGETPLTLDEVEDLRLVQHKLNPRKERTTSRYRGVSWYPTRRTWRVCIAGGRAYYCKSEVEAAYLYDQLAREHFGAKAQLNFPQEHTS